MHAPPRGARLRHREGSASLRRFIFVITSYGNAMSWGENPIRFGAMGPEVNFGSHG